MKIIVIFIVTVCLIMTLRKFFGHVLELFLYFEYHVATFRLVPAVSYAFFVYFILILSFNFVYKYRPHATFSIGQYAIQLNEFFYIQAYIPAAYSRVNDRRRRNIIITPSELTFY